jgi:hypothetical protein
MVRPIRPGKVVPGLYSFSAMLFLLYLVVYLGVDVLPAVIGMLGQKDVGFLRLRSVLVRFPCARFRRSRQIQ